ncbi:oligosaccharide flippase family protein [Candidatus Omnitrophota bacterium]
MKKLYKATAIMGVSTFVAMAIGILRAKFLAITLGPSGVGIFSQAVTFFQSAETICGLGICLGLTKYVSEMWQKRNIAEVKKTIMASFVLQVVAFFIFFILIVIFSKQISQFVFSSDQYSMALILISGGVLFSILVTTLESTLLGLGRPDSFSKARIVYYLVGFAILAGLVGTMKLKGGFLYIALNYITSFLVVGAFLIYALKSAIKLSFRSFIKGFLKLDFRFYFKKLLSYGVAVLGSAAVTWLAVLYIRSILIKEAGASANGFYQVVFALTSYYSPFFTNGLWGYLFPKLSAIDNISHFNLEVNKAFRFIIIFAVPAILILFLIRKEVVLLIFSKEFLPSLALFPLYLSGSLFYMITCILGNALLAKKELKAFFTINLVQYLLYALLFTFLVRRVGLIAIAISYLATNIVGNILCGSFLIKKMKFSLKKDNVILLGLAVFVMGIILFVPLESILVISIKWVLVALWFLYAIRKREKALLRSFIRSRLPWKKSR